MQPGFFNLPLAVRTVDGESFELSSALGFIRRDGTALVVLVGSTTDGPSIPHWTGIPRTGKKWLPGVLHDGAYRGKLEKRDDLGNWVSWLPTKEESDLLFKEALLVNGVPAGEAELFYLAVKEFGQPAFDADRRLVQ